MWLTHYCSISHKNAEYVYGSIFREGDLNMLRVKAKTGTAVKTFVIAVRWTMARDEPGTYVTNTIIIQPFSAADTAAAAIVR